MAVIKDHAIFINDKSADQTKHIWAAAGEWGGVTLTPVQINGEQALLISDFPLSTTERDKAARDIETRRVIGLSPVHVTDEPSEANSDGGACTLYFRVSDLPTVARVRRYIEDHAVQQAGLGRIFEMPGPVSLDVDDPYFEVVETEDQPFGEYRRFQAYPCG